MFFSCFYHPGYHFFVFQEFSVNIEIAEGAQKYEVVAPVNCVYNMYLSLQGPEDMIAFYGFLELVHPYKVSVVAVDYRIDIETRGVFTEMLGYKDLFYKRPELRIEFMAVRAFL